MENSIQILDCTLRDGGYCNQWNFGSANIQKILLGLLQSKVNIIECGFLTNRVISDKDRTKFASLDDISQLIPPDRGTATFVCMVNYGEYPLDALPPHDNSSVDGIRVAFHKKDRFEALEYCKGLLTKGYKVYIQPMVSLAYSDDEFLELIELTNTLDASAFYIVDSFGTMQRKDLMRYYSLAKQAVRKGVCLGFHSHNNKQLAHSNAQLFVDHRGERAVIIDSSVYGMGRGAGNLNTELFIDYLNLEFDTTYMVKPLLMLVDEVLSIEFRNNPWGYSFPNYLSALYGCHPYYANYLDDKKTLTLEAMSDLFEMIAEDKKCEFDPNYFESLYIQYMSENKSTTYYLDSFKETVADRSILLVAPGKSSLTEKDRIHKMAVQKKAVTIGVNFSYSNIALDYVFISNMRRYRELKHLDASSIIATSNIKVDGVTLVDYLSLRNNREFLADNAGMMLIKLLSGCDVKEILLAGFDGYSATGQDEYTEGIESYTIKKAIAAKKNSGMDSLIREYSRGAPISFLTTPKYVGLSQ